MTFKIGDIEIKNQVVLAPMAGICNHTFRKIIEEMGAGLIYTEMISAEALVRGNKKTLDMLKGINEHKIPVAVQLFGGEPDTMAKAAKIVAEACGTYHFAIVDINMGCPVPKVAIKSQAGAALLKNPDKIYEIVSSVVQSVPCPVTVKIRSGWDSNNINAVEVAKICEKAGASAICVHPRTRAQGYSGNADWNIIKLVKETVSIPVIGNGDIKTCYDAKRMLDETNCDFVMIGRACLGNPWLIREVVSYLGDGTVIEKPNAVQKIDMCLKHIDYLLSIQNEKQVVLEIRSHIAWYLKGIKGSNEIKKQIFSMKNIEEIKKLLLEFMKIC